MGRRLTLPVDPKTPFALSLSKGSSLHRRRRRKNGPSTSSGRTEKGSHVSIVILTGAGVSAESGIDTFRDGGGLWEQHRVEDVATPEAFARDPDLVLRFYDMRRAAIQTKGPNAAHDALARLAASCRASC